VRVHFVSHPEVQIRPDIPVVDWPLSDVGISRARLLADFFERLHIDRPVLSSPEVKAEQTARIVGDSLGVGFELIAGLAEIDRSATGYLPEPDFWATYHDFLSSPATSARGWETAQDAQRRIVRTVDELLSAAEPESDTVLVSNAELEHGWLPFERLESALDARHDGGDGVG
jgi:broad specificity phosphatase PhoE